MTTTSAEHLARLLKTAEEEAEQRGYIRGLKAAIATLQTLAEASPPPRAGRPRRTSLRQTVQSRVLRFVTELPGKRGIDLVNLATPASERTVRTALYRLRELGQIEQRDDGWYPTVNVLSTSDAVDAPNH